MKKRSRQSSVKKLKYTFAACLLAFLLLTLLVLKGAFSGFEEDLFIYIFGASDRLWYFALAVTQLGSVWFFIALVGLMFVLRWKPNASVRLIVFGAAVTLSSYAVKLLVSKPRPSLIFEDAITRSITEFSYGYPSGHTALATAVCLALLPFLPGKAKWIVGPWILLVGWSRIYLGVHAPFDVLGGFLLAVAVVSGLLLLPGSKLSRYLKT